MAALRRQASGYALVVPALLLYVVFVIVPLLRTIVLSASDWNGLRRTFDWVGSDNYARLVADQRFWGDIGHNLFWALGSLIPQALGLVLAAIVAEKWVRGRTFFRLTFFVPVTMSLVVVGIVWGLLYNPAFGLINQTLATVGLEGLQRAWLADPGSALAAIVTTANWTYYGFAFVIFLAGVQGIDGELYEAATVDGAGAWKRFIYVTVPSLRNQITLLLLVSFINTLRTFDLVYVMTSGGPGTATEVVGYYIYKLAFVTHQVGYGSAAAILLTVLIFASAGAFLIVRERLDR
jgi:raffinose/stachyose/melibiose transport system permease protein